MVHAMKIGTGFDMEFPDVRLRLPAILSDHMVLQRHTRLRLWGKAADGERIEVSLAHRKQSCVARHGAWAVELEPLDAGGPYELVIASGAESIAIYNVMVGDVWICSGQSNMQWPLRAARGGAAEAERAHVPAIRLFRQEARAADRPEEDIPGGKWLECSPLTAGDFSGVGYFFGRQLYEKLQVPIGLMQAAVGATSAQSWMSREAFAGSERLRHILAETDRIETDELKRPGALFNGMIAPLQRYAARGVIWYQGERNAIVHHPGHYGAILSALIADWRRGWNTDELAFLIVQLPGYGGPEEGDWALLREEQFTVGTTVRNAGVAVTIDAGESDNIHPADKRVVGERLALLAEALVYGADVVCSGPVCHSATLVNEKVLVAFRHAGSGGLTTCDGSAQVKGFTICDGDGYYKEARAEIVGAGQVVVWHDEVARPSAVRYAWNNDPKVNLINREGLPAFPFRTDINQRQ